MIFVTLGKYKMKPTKESNAQAKKGFEQMAKEGVKFISQYWTLGKYDFVAVAEAKDEKTYMRAVLRWGDMISSQTLIAIPTEEAMKLVE